MYSLIAGTTTRNANAGADLGFPVGIGANRQNFKLSNFLKNCIKLRTFQAVGGGGIAGCAPLNPPLER